MSLKDYNKKRKFNKTPEPKGKKVANSGPLTFVIQRHQATQLHYDFRLELDGVLKSWAVPKGPSMDPEDKRLAMMVEDHPMEYKDFEGIIPKGNYGAGTVMVWDSGVYSPLDSVDRKKAEKILMEQLEKGHLTFVLLGKKLKGEFALVKTGLEENSWLLIKKGDEYAKKIDILEEDKSVLTGRSMEQISKQAEGKNEVWYSKPKDLDLHGIPSGSMPHNVKPMLAITIDKPFNKKDWLFELKWDGYRAIAEIESGKVKLYSRNGQSFNDKFSPVAESLTKFPGNAVLDGEVVVLDEKGHPSFQMLQDFQSSKNGEIVYYVFDILYLDGHNLEKLPLTERKEFLKKVLPPLPHVSYSDHIEETGEEFFKQAEKLGLEGIMAKKADSEYKEGYRTENWLKIKTHMRQEAVIAGFTEPKGSRQHLGALVLGVYENNKLRYIGHTGGGFNDKTLKSVYEKLKPLSQKTCPFKVEPPTNAPVTWVKPKLVAEVTFQSWTNEGIMRQPIFVGLREDKPPAQVIHEPVTLSEAKGIKTKELDSSAAPQNDSQGGGGNRFSKEAPGKEEVQEIEVSKRKLKLVNLSKIFWPKEGYTKGDLLDYYKEVAPVLLPHLINRPQSLLRFPNGIEGQSFFQKDVSNLRLDWMSRAHFKHEGKTVEYMLCQDEASLLYIINLGCIDLNPWNSTIKSPDKPDWLVIDLDPEKVDFDKVVNVALAAREVLESLGIESFPKTSGASGMHIYIPMAAKYDYEQVRYFAELLCTQIQAKIPQITSMVRNPKDRQGKVYLDFLQNSRGQTLASVYSVRPKPCATVSTPLNWSEVTLKLHPSQFTMKNIPSRLQKHGDLFKGVLEKGVNIERVLKSMERLI